LRTSLGTKADPLPPDTKAAPLPPDTKATPLVIRAPDTKANPLLRRQQSLERLCLLIRPLGGEADEVEAEEDYAQQAFAAEHAYFRPYPLQYWGRGGGSSLYGELYLTLQTRRTSESHSAVACMLRLLLAL
jgi:hypothetical protein